MYRISELARQFELSRSTLLYYDRIGLLSPSARSQAGYRLYREADRSRLETICSFRKAGLAIEDIKLVMDTADGDTTAVLQQRLLAVGKEIRALQTKQYLLAGMLRLQRQGGPLASVDKEMFVELLRAADMDDHAMMQLHSEFERRAPQAHHSFLLMLGISESEARHIRAASRDASQAKGPG